LTHQKSRSLQERHLAPFSKRFEEIVGEACESAASSQVARRFQPPETTVRANRRTLAPASPQATLKQLGVDEIYRGTQYKLLPAVCDLETNERLWFGKGAEEVDAGRVLPNRTPEPAAQAHRCGVRRYVGAVPLEHRAMGSR